ncbi:BnaC03g64650D [Brassica napus]|uniref:BnaC03g64650D protein n=2 Tax=Brassica napus TaxID=3708 RepID=A0A078GLF3_BRANA|nr:BnaC03g64650D [Brassica napus]
MKNRDKPKTPAPYSTFVVPNSPLYYAAGHEVNQFLLVESGVDIINLWNYRGKTALMQACQHGHWEDIAFRVYNKCPQLLEPVEE